MRGVANRHHRLPAGVQFSMNLTANALQLEGSPTSRQWAVLANFVLRMRTYCSLRAFDQNLDIAFRFSHLDVLKGSNNLAIRRRFHTMTLTFDT